MKQIRTRITYANVMSSIAVFLVLGGATALAAGHLGKNSVGSKQLKKESVTAAKIKNGTIIGAKLNLSSIGKVPSAVAADTATTAKTATNATNATNAVNATNATNATNAVHATSADNATTVAGHNYGFAHIVFSGATPTVDTANSSAGVSVAASAVIGTSCVTAPFAAHAVSGSVDFLQDPGNVEVLEASPVQDTNAHRCPQGTIEVNTQKADGLNAGAGTPTNVAYYLLFS